MANVLDSVREGISLFQRAKTIFENATKQISESREVVNETRLDRLQATLEAEKLETQQASDDLMAAIKEARANLNKG